ncbi:NUDIX domain-containing protein, partial [Candidatus Woesearchaeota archaeon]|nr:NUDIX domain-containing protein [Candidatus Woesearchaeota archaeon]
EVIEIPNLGKYMLAYSNNSKNFTQKQKENFQIFDYDDDSIFIDDLDLIMYRGECHGKKRLKSGNGNLTNELYHRGVNVLLIKDNHVFLPTRGDKDLYSGMTDFSISEHVKVGERYKTASSRGFFEELRNHENNPLIINEDELKLYLNKTLRAQDQSEQVKYYTVDYRGNENIKLSNEVKGGKWYEISDLQNKLRTNGDLNGLNFRPDHLPAFERFLQDYRGKLNG